MGFIKFIVTVRLVMCYFGYASPMYPINITLSEADEPRDVVDLLSGRPIINIHVQNLIQKHLQVI